MPRLVDVSGFSRQSTWSRDSIKAKFGTVKHELRQPVPKVKPRTVDDRIAHERGTVCTRERMHGEQRPGEVRGRKNVGSLALQHLV